MKRCPHCDQTLPEKATPPVRLSRQQHILYTRIVSAGANGATVDSLVHDVWADDKNGGPLDAVGQIHIYISLINKRLRLYGEELTRHTAIPGRYVLCKGLDRFRDINDLSRAEIQRIIELSRSRGIRQIDIATLMNISRNDVRKIIGDIKTGDRRGASVRPNNPKHGGDGSIHRENGRLDGQ